MSETVTCEGAANCTAVLHLPTCPVGIQREHPHVFGVLLDSEGADEAGDLLYEAWGVIANAHGGDWDSASPEWKAAAERWRDRWHGQSGSDVPSP